MAMFEEMSFEDWLPKIKVAYAAAGLTPADDDEIWELLYMELREANQSIEEHIEEAKAGNA